MPKFVVEFSLPYRHVVQVGVSAGDADEAREKVRELLDCGEAFDNTAEVPLLKDEFEEDCDSGEVLEFDVLRALADDQIFPPKDASVLVIEQDALALKACEMMVEAYGVDGEDNGGSVRWEDLDDVHATAKAALARFLRRRLRDLAPASEERYFAVTGSMPGEEESSTLVFKARDRDHAIQQFSDRMWSTPVYAGQREWTATLHGVDCFIDVVVASDSPIAAC